MIISGPEKSTLELMKQKLDALREILLYTSKVEYTGEDSDAEKYVSLIAKREEFFERMRGNDAKLESGGIKASISDSGSDFKHEVDRLNNEIRETAEKISKLDEEMNQKAAAMLLSLKGNIKEIRVGKNVSSLYRNEVLVGQRTHFDQKK